MIRALTSALKAVDSRVGSRLQPTVGMEKCDGALAGPVREVREQPHFVLGPKSTCHVSGPCGAKRGVPFAATRERHVHHRFARRMLLTRVGGT